MFNIMFFLDLFIVVFVSDVEDLFEYIFIFINGHLIKCFMIQPIDGIRQNHLSL